MFRTLLCGVMLTSSSLVAQQGGSPSGDYAGLLMNFRVKLHLFASQPQESGLVLKAKQLSQAAVDATIAVRQTPGHEDFTPPSYDNLQVIAKYRLRSDGSR